MEPPLRPRAFLTRFFHEPFLESRKVGWPLNLDRSGRKVAGWKGEEFETEIWEKFWGKVQIQWRKSPYVLTRNRRILTNFNGNCNRKFQMRSIIGSLFRGALKEINGTLNSRNEEILYLRIPGKSQMWKIVNSTFSIPLGNARNLQFQK